MSPFVGGRTLKGPTDDFCRFAGIETNAAGIARAYGDVLDGIVADEEVPGIDCLVTGHADGAAPSSASRLRRTPSTLRRSSRAEPRPEAHAR